MKIAWVSLPAILLGTLLPLAARPAAGADRPNILLVIADDWSNGHSGIQGCPWIKTPAFDRVAREGMLFRNGFTSNPKCSPCRASILTGRNTWQLDEACNHFGVFSARFAVYPDLLEKAGYHVGYTGKGWGPGDFKAGGFERNPAGPGYNQRRIKPPHQGINAIDYAGNFELFLKDRKPDSPFCFWYGATEPHRNYEEGAGVRSGKKIQDVTLPAYYPNSNVIKSDILDYALEVEWFDQHLGRMIELLEERGELENTLILVTSDHGMPFPRVKGQIYEEGFHLPLAIRWGKTKGGRTIDDFINVRDFAPTFLALAGLEPHPQMSGRSFLDILQSDQSGWIDRSRNRMLVGKERHDIGRPHDWGYPVRAIRTPEFLYVHNYHPERWPAGNPETGYRNVDDGPTKELLLSKFDDHYRLSFGARAGGGALPDHRRPGLREEPRRRPRIRQGEAHAADPRWRNSSRRKKTPAHSATVRSSTPTNTSATGNTAGTPGSSTTDSRRIIRRSVERAGFLPFYRPSRSPSAGAAGFL